ncbi:MAG: hypothetical protein M3Y42_03945 [Actinomycetota bacterium]|nr:hypothetical protein [Actinomycetota bacterium]MDQ2956102.1 hypothetical protein [Actinomycetota bacterium]
MSSGPIELHLQRSRFVRDTGDVRNQKVRWRGPRLTGTDGRVLTQIRTLLGVIAATYSAAFTSSR